MKIQKNVCVAPAALLGFGHCKEKIPRKVGHIAVLTPGLGPQDGLQELGLWAGGTSGMTCRSRTILALHMLDLCNSHTLCTKCYSAMWHRYRFLSNDCLNRLGLKMINFGPQAFAMLKSALDI